MSEIREYAEEVVKYVENGEVVEVEKANGVKFTGIVVRNGSVCPTIYLEEMFEERMPVALAAKKVNELAKLPKPDFIVDKMKDFRGFVKGKLRARLYNEKTFAEVQRSAKDYGFEDLIIVPYIDVETNGATGKGSIKVKRDFLDMWDVSEEEVIDIALENSAQYVKIETINDMMSRMMGAMTVPLPVDILVITNDAQQYGAVSVISKLNYLRERYEDGFCVIPSSIHEVIITPKNSNDGLALANIIKDVNATVVKPEEVLSDKAYEF